MKTIQDSRDRPVESTLTQIYRRIRSRTELARKLTSA
jgi:hypothetical protein